MSTSAPDGSAVAQRLVHGSGPYRLVDGTVIAKDWADLVDGALEAGISLNEEGDPVGGATATWVD